MFLQILQVCICQQLSSGQDQWHLPPANQCPGAHLGALLTGGEKEVLRRKCQEVLQALV